MKKIHHQFFNNQSTEISSSSKIDNIIQKGEVIFKKNPTVGLPVVSKMIDLAISKKQGDQRKHSFLEKKNTSQKEKWIQYEHPELTSLDESCCEAFDSSISQILFSDLKMFRMQCRKTLQLKITKNDEYS